MIITEPGVYDIPATGLRGKRRNPVNDCPIGLGNRTGYRRGCKCPACRAGNAAGVLRYRPTGSLPGGRPPVLEPPDIDEIAVERCLKGTLPATKLTAPERREAVAVGRRRGLSHREIARRMGLSDRSVVRIAAKLKEMAA